MPSLMRITRLVREFLTSSTAIVTASIVAATVSSGTVSAKRAQTPSPLFPCNGGLETRSGKREDEHVEAEIPFEKLFKAGLNIPYSDLLVMDQIAFTRGGYDAVRLWDGSDAEALNAMNKEERHNYFTRLLNESKIGAALQKDVWDQNGHLYNFEKRFKTPHSVYESLHSRPNAPSDIAGISDLIRYSAIFDTRSYTDSTLKILNEMQNKGYLLRSVWNAWCDNQYPYNAVNVTLESPEDGLFEIQFHTPEGAVINDGTHKMYEKRRLYRKGSPEYLSLLKEQREAAASIEVPQNIEAIATFNHAS